MVLGYQGGVAELLAGTLGAAYQVRGCVRSLRVHLTKSADNHHRPLHHHPPSPHVK